MKILVIPSWYPSKSHPNNGIFFKEQSEAFKHNNCEVEVLSVEIPYRKAKKDYKYFVKNESVENGIHTYRYVFPVGILHRFPRLYYLFLKIVGEYIYKKEFREKGEYIIHAHSFGIGGYIGICLKKKFDLKCIITEHTSKILKGELSLFEKHILKRCVAECDEFVCVSENLKRHVEDIVKIKERIKVYPNMVRDIFQYKAKKKNPFLIVSIGNLKYEKRMDLIIEGFCSAFTESDNVFLSIVGKGDEYDALNEMVEKKKRNHQIKLIGELGRDKVVELLKESHVMALVSEKETFGIVYVEGIISGNVVIGAHNGGADDIINKQNGVFISEFTGESVGIAFREVYNNYEKYQTEEISKEGKRIYGEKAFVNYYLNLFKH